MNAIPFPKSYQPDKLGTHKMRVIIHIIAASAITLSVGGYFFYQAKGFIMGPKLEVTSPTDGQTFSSASVKVEGGATPGAQLTINGMKVYSDGTGRFSEDLLLARGIHVLQIVAKDRFGKEREIARQINVK